MDLFFLILSLILPVCGFCCKGSFINVTVKEGEDCDLPCSCPESIKLSLVEWIQHPKKTVLFYRGGYVQNGQHPQFKDRVIFKHDPSKNDFTVTISNVTFTDTGHYECQVHNGKKLSSRIVSLTVEGRGSEAAQLTLTPPTGSTQSLRPAVIALSVIVVILCIVIGVLLHRLKQRRKEQSGQGASSCPENQKKALLHLNLSALLRRVCAQDPGVRTSFDSSLESDLEQLK